MADKWTKPYSREYTTYPAPWLRASKFWPTTCSSLAPTFKTPKDSAKKVHQSLSRNKTMEKKDDTFLHIAARQGDLDGAFDIMSSCDEQKLVELLLKKNQSGEIALYVAAEYGCVDLVKEMIKYYDSEAASVKAKNGFDAFHIAAKQGNLACRLHGDANLAKIAARKVIALEPEHCGSYVLMSSVYGTLARYEEVSDVRLN